MIGNTEKKYKIGFTAGTFDMFHIGHLNLLTHAKKQCEYLIVGVNSDELVLSYKNKQTIIPDFDRLAIVNAIKVVDEVHLMDNLDKIDAWEKYKFDAVFIGDDWKDSERWIQSKEKLGEIGVDVCFIQYTQGISSTKLVDILQSKN